MISIKEETFIKIKDVFYRNNGYARMKTLLEANIHSSQVRELVDNGTIVIIKRGLYKWDNWEVGEHEELINVCKIVPNGIISLLSALSFYELTTYNPWEHYISIPINSKKPILPEYPPVKLIYFSRTHYELGIKTLDILGNQVKIYDQEKTICDCIRYRNKIGMDIVKEALQEYVKMKQKNINKLMEYAEILRVKKILSEYLEVLL